MGASTSDSWMNMDMDGAWYLGAKAGGNWMDHNTHFLSHTSEGRIDGFGSFEDGYVGAIQGGYAFNNGLHLEIEGSTKYNQSDRFRAYGAGRGTLRDYAGMVNAIYELPLDYVPLHPYIGAGVGMSDYSPDHVRGDLMPYPAYFSGDKWGFAYQAIGGVAYDVDDNIALTLEYRYFSHPNDYPSGIRNDYDSHSALIGVRYTFGEPVHEAAPAVYVPPRPAPAPAPSPRNYLVFFDFNKSDLTPDARAIVDKAAANSKTASITKLDVTGYTDTVGSDAYNMRLSRRRAESVAAELEAQGVPSGDIAIYAKGKHDLLVPTADGVREPQNRRVQIVYASGPSS